MSSVSVFIISACLIAYVYGVYPALMASLALLPPRPRSRGASSEPRVTLVIPAHNEAGVLEGKIRNALRIDYPADRLEIVVASDGSTDETAEIARRFSEERLRTLDFPTRRGKCAVLNDAAIDAAGDVLFFCDANVSFRSDALKRLVARLDDPQVGAASGDVRLASRETSFGEGESLYYRIERAVQAGESRVGSMMAVDGGMYVMRRELFHAPPADTILDDFVISMRVITQGRRIVYEPAAVATETCTPSAREEFRRRVRISAGAIQSLKRGVWPPISRPIELWQYLSHKPLRWAGPYFLAAFFMSNASLFNAGAAYRLTFGLQVFALATAAAATLSTRVRKTWLGGVPFYFVMSHVAMVVGHLKGTLNAQRVTWKRTERGHPTRPGLGGVGPKTVEPLA